MQTLEKNITSFEKILAIVQNDYLSKEEILRMLEKMVEIVKELREKQNIVVDDLEKTYANLLKKLEQEYASMLDEMRNTTSTISETKSTLETETKIKLKELTDDFLRKIADIKYNQTEYENKVVENVLTKIPEPDTPEIIRNKLETLTEDNRLDKNAIKGLKEEIEDLKKDIGKRPLSGGLLSNWGLINTVRHYDVSSQFNGVLKAFEVPSHRRAILFLSSQFPIIFRPTVDFTTANKTLTLTDTVGIPESGQTGIFLYIK